jgi:hypothetical protein
MSGDLKSGIVRILRLDGSAAGTGFLISESGLIVTCSHVLQDHKAQEIQQRPDEAIIEFRVGGASRTARIVSEWWSGFNSDDVAFLQCDGDLPEGAKPLPLGSSTGSNGHRFETFGFPVENPVGGLGGKGEIVVPTDIARGASDTLRPAVQISSTEVTRGFSGAPVWDTHTSRVIGMVAAIAQPDAYGRLPQTAFITPAETLKAICPRLQLLDFRPLNWLKQWPSGFTALDDRRPSGFRAFLHSDQLLYLARDSWQPPAGLRHPWTETSLVEKLTEAEVSHPVVVLIGPGGVGKTRLGLEIARRMRKLGWWTIHCDGMRATTAGLRQLLAESSNPTRVLLFVDYLEIWRDSFEAFVNEVLDLDELSGHQVRVIATCRASHRDRLPPFIKPREVGSEAAIEAAYSKAVTEHILSTLGAGDIDDLAEKCRYNFALAAFLLFLKQERPEKFAGEISALREEPTFEDWIVKRLKNAGLKDIFVPAAMLAACEFPATTFDALANAHGAAPDELRRVLIADKWIERHEAAEGSADGPVWAVFHDVFADVILAHALGIAPNRDDAIDRLLELAAANSVFPQTLAALGRLAQTKMILAIDWRSRLLELERRSTGTLASHAQVLLTSALLAPETRVDFIAANNALREAVARDPACDIGVALTAAAWSDALATDVQRREFECILLPLLDAAAARETQSNMVLRLGFAARPDRYRDAAWQWIDTHRRLFQTHFLRKAWLDHSVDELKSGDPEGTAYIEAIREAVSEWLWALATSIHASFVLAPWLNAAAAIGGECAVAMVERVKDHVAAWLAHSDHAIRDDAKFIYTSWLNAAAPIGGERAVAMVAIVQGHMAAWLAHRYHAIIDESFVYTSWLKVAAAIGGEPAADMVAIVQGHVAAWLAHRDHAISDDAGFVHTSWLNAAAAIGGERAVAMVERVEDHVAAWLAHRDHAISDDAKFIYTSWLNAAAPIGGERAVAMVERVEDHVAAWLAHRDHAISDDANFVYRSWLEAAQGNQQRRFYTGNSCLDFTASRP